jgi:hypothetical protein
MPVSGLGAHPRELHSDPDFRAFNVHCPKTALFSGELWVKTDAEHGKVKIVAMSLTL